MKKTKKIFNWIFKGLILSYILLICFPHLLFANKLGLLKYKLLPSWKNEGYCDFIANESSFNKQKGVKEICNDTENTDIPSFKYFKYRMITEYLFEERKITLEKFLDEDFDLENINNNLKKKYCAQ